MCAERLLANSGQIISEVSAALAGAEPDPEAVAAVVVDVLSRTYPGLWVASLMTKNPNLTRVFAADPRNADSARYIERMQRGGGLTSAPVSSRVIESGEPLLISMISVNEFTSSYLDAQTLGRLESDPFPPTGGYLSVLVVPMRAQDTIVGTLGVFAPDASQPLGEKDIRWLQTVADQTGLAVSNAQLQGDARNRLARLLALQEVIHAIRAAHDPMVTLKTVVARIASVLEVDACDVLTIDEADKKLVVAASTGFVATAVSEFRLALDNSLVNQALESHHIENLRSSTVLDQARRRSLFAREGFRAYAASSLNVGERWLGALEIFHKTDLNPDPEWFDFLDAMAGLAAVAVDQAALRERAQQARPRRSETAPNLNRTELQILRLVVEGHTNREIAAQIHLSQSTIKFHVRQILDKTGTTNRTDLTRRATREGWV